MQVLTSDSLEILRRAVNEKPTIIEESFEDISTDLRLKFVGSGLLHSTKFDLITPEGMAQEQNKDDKNCLIIAEALGHLKPAEATDERFWVTLCFQEFPVYVRERWPLSKAQSAANHVNNHWFAKNNRNRIRDNAISRLWWMGRLAKLVPDATTETVLQTLFFNSDYRSSLLERSSSANAMSVISAILNISQKHFDKGNVNQVYLCH